MDMHDEADVRTWLDIHNDAFGRRWGRAQYEAALVTHPHLDVLRTYFALQDGVPVAAGSVAVFRRNREIGVCHYLGVRRAHHRRGLGRRLTLLRYHTLREWGLLAYEMETTIDRRASLQLHFDCGFKPKPWFDAWNTPDESPRWLRALATMRLERLYARWKRR